MDGNEFMSLMLPRQLSAIYGINFNQRASIL